MIVMLSRSGASTVMRSMNRLGFFQSASHHKREHPSTFLAVSWNSPPFLHRQGSFEVLPLPLNFRRHDAPGSVSVGEIYCAGESKVAVTQLPARSIQHLKRTIGFPLAVCNTAAYLTFISPGHFYPIALRGLFFVSEPPSRSGSTPATSSLVHATT